MEADPVRKVGPLGLFFQRELALSQRMISRSVIEVTKMSLKFDISGILTGLTKIEPLDGLETKTIPIKTLRFGAVGTVLDITPGVVVPHTRSPALNIDVSSPRTSPKEVI